MINWNTESNSMNLMSEAPMLAFSLAVGAVLVVALLVVLDKRES